MDLDELRAFLAVVETGSFSGAANSLNFARATLRRRVDELEARSGVQLLKRAADAATVTKAGELLAKKGREILGETRELFAAVRALESQRDLITLELPVGQPPQMERRAHSTLRKTAPNLRWRVRYSNGAFNPESDALVVIHYGDRVDPGLTDWHHVRVGRVPIQLVASAEYLERAGVPESVEELQSHPLFVWERHDRNPAELQRAGGGEPLTIDPTLVTPSAYLARYFSAQGDGIGYVPNTRLATFLGDTEGVVPVMPELVGDQASLWVSTRRDNEAGPFGILVQAITRFVGAAVGGPD